jgi:molecular chaperone HscB
MQNYFEIFGLTPSMNINLKELEAKYFQLQKDFHPDKMVLRDGIDKMSALRISARVNDAYQTLKSDIKLAEYILKLNNIDIEKAKPSQALLMQSLEDRESLQESKSIDEINDLEKITKEKLAKARVLLEEDLSKQDYNNFTNHFHEFKYLDKLLEEISVKKRFSGL